MLRSRRYWMLLILLSIVLREASFVKARRDEVPTSYLRVRRALQDETQEEECRLQEVCRLCGTSEKDSIPECIETGKVQMYSCESDTEDDKMSTRTKYESCLKTEIDEQYTMVRLQVICLLLGSFALLSVKRLKVQSASLFDQRRIAARDKRKPADQTGIEMTGTAREETVPLTDANLEVV